MATVSIVTNAPIEHIYYEGSLSAREIQRHRKSHSVSVSESILYLVFRYLKVPTVVPKYRNTEFHSVFPALPDGHACFKTVFNPLVNFLKEVPVYA